LFIPRKRPTDWGLIFLILKPSRKFIGLKAGPLTSPCRFWLGLSQSLAKKHWPGPLTLVLEIKNQKNQESNKLKIKNLKLNKNLKLKIGNYQTLGLRISSNKLATAIVKKLGGPLTATSANLAGQKECYSAEAVVKQFKDRKHQPDLIIDAGRLPAHPVSTVTRVIDGQVKVLRKGKIYGPSASDKRVN